MPVQNSKEVNMNKKVDFLEIERKIIHLLLKDKNAIQELIDDNYTSDIFDISHKHLVDCIFSEFVSSEHKRTLNRNAYKEYIFDDNNQKNLISLLSVYDKCYLQSSAVFEDLGFLKRSLIENYACRKVKDSLKDLNINAGKIGWYEASRKLTEDLSLIVSPTESKKTVFSTIADLREEFFEKVEFDKKNPHTVIECGIPEIDGPVGVGFMPMHLTLFVADVGGQKTGTMLNVALNISEKKHNVMFVPLEMNWRDLVKRMVCNRANIEPRKLAKPWLLSNDELEAMKKSSLFENKNLCILDASDRPNLFTLTAEIEKRVSYFKPKVLVLDYADILESSHRYKNRTDEIGHMLHSLRNLGKKHGFHIISAAQMNRDAIKALKDSNDTTVDSTSIYGSHNYSAASDTIFALIKTPNDPTRLKIYTIKARHGPAGQIGELKVQPDRYYICSTSGVTQLMNSTDIETALNVSPSEIQEHKKKKDIKFNSQNLDDW